MISFKRNYFGLAVILFITEVLIALFVTDKFIRPYVGDFLVVILMYCFLKAFVNISVFKAAIGVLIFAYLIEGIQYFDVLKSLGLNHIYIIRLVLGNFFEWGDIVAYTLGIATVIIIEKLRQPGKVEPS